MISSKEFAKECDLVLCPRYNTNLEFPENTPKRVFITGEYGIFEQSLKYLKKI
jgi:hypothetical protein